MSTDPDRIQGVDEAAIAAKTTAQAAKLNNAELVDRLTVAISRRDKASMRMQRVLPESITWCREFTQFQRNTVVMKTLLAELAKR